MELGIRPGEPIAILMGNEIEYVETFYACTKLGCPIALANYGYTEDELASVLRSCKTTTLIMVLGFDRYDYRPWLSSLKRNIPSLNHILMVDGADDDHKYTTPYEHVLEEGSRSSVVRSNHQAFVIMNLQFTSSSTGLP